MKSINLFEGESVLSVQELRFVKGGGNPPVGSEGESGDENGELPGELPVNSGKN